MSTSFRFHKPVKSKERFFDINIFMCRCLNYRNFLEFI
ncbi:unnamed protein product [Schistosoma curassoni]|uniref:Uncharacterized protein n=1 Tax=Schistosoma curassoni TaxID=6186 RepID=A0A183KEG7_9TREM|nr:unnamed protein product [Schistosoma curassoni]